VIDSFKHRGLKRLYELGDESRINPQHLAKIRDILSVLDVTKEIEAMNLATFRLHPLTGNLDGFWSITVRANWRLIFRFDNGKASDVDLIDYH
jgi:proteic killer suppression protein